MLIGLTGKSCSGKNYVSEYFSRRGFEVWDLDREAAKIRRQKHKDIFEAFGTTDSTKLRTIVFSDSEKLNILENIIYPVLVQKIKECKYDLVINGATLKRSGLDLLCTFIIYVDAPYEIRLKRAIDRDGITESEFAKREKAQDDVDYRKVSYACPVYPINTTEDWNSQIDDIFNNLMYTAKP